MKKIYVTILALIISVPTLAAENKPEVISMQTIESNGSQISLPKVRMENGEICQSYLAAVSVMPASEKGVTTTYDVAQICDKPAILRGGQGFPDQEYPAKLKSLRTVKTEDGLAIQVPQISN